MIKNELKTPTLRFLDFTSDWENKKLGDIAHLVTEKVNISDIIVDNYISTYNMNSNLGGINIAKKLPNINSVTSFKKGDILFSNIRTYFRKVWQASFDGGCSNDILVFRSNEESKFPNDYIYKIITDNNFINYTVATSKGVKMPRGDKQAIITYEILCPMNFDECKKIAVFLSSVDKRIDLLQQKHDTFIQYKNALMQGLFPQKGQTNPSMRLNDKNNNPFTKNWQNKKLGDVAKFSKGQGLSKNDIIENGKNDCILYGELYTKYYENINTVYSKTNIESNSCSKVGDLLFPASTTTNATDLATASVVNKDNILLSGDINIVRLNLEEYSPLCLSYMIRSSLKKNIARLGQGITIVHLYNSHLKTICFKSPELEEQNKIAGFLSAVDKKIENISNQLNQSKQFKKSLMQKMFI